MTAFAMFSLLSFNRFGKYSHDELSILVPLNQCCRYVSRVVSHFIQLFPLIGLPCSRESFIARERRRFGILPGEPDPSEPRALALPGWCFGGIRTLQERGWGLLRERLY